MTSNSNISTNFNGTTSFIDIISTCSNASQYVYTLGTSTTPYQDSQHTARFFYLGNLLIQFSDISQFGYGGSAPLKGNITINFPISFSNTPYYIGVTPFDSGNSPLSITYINNVGFSVAVSNNNTYVTFIAIGPR